MTEFEVWSKPGGALPAEFGKAIQGHVWGCGVAPDVFLGVSNIPDESDVCALESLIEQSPAEEQRFLSFCRSRGLTARRGDATSAARYIEFVQGCCVAWIHLPSGPDERALLRKIEAAISPFDLIVRSP
ncbi:MAG: hypothetical protein EKK53_08245 [Burkholderiales bacterium]|nr:MAG: hypothetical protein EKK53_08245 [Burkholderiales bacterium]